MNAGAGLLALQKHAEGFAKGVATAEGEWIVKGFIDIYKRIYTVSVDTKIISKVIELLLFPMFADFCEKHEFTLELSPQQNFYPDLTFRDSRSGFRFAVDVKSTYRTSARDVNGMTLGAFTGYFRNRSSKKNTLYPYEQYHGHFALGVIYDKCDEIADEKRIFALEDLHLIPSVVRNFSFFAQPKYRIASSRPGSGNTRNIGSVSRIEQLIEGAGPFSTLGEKIYDDYWMYYQTKDMALALDLERPYRNLKEYLDYKSRGLQSVTDQQKEAAKQSDAASITGDDDL